MSDSLRTDEERFVLRGTKLRTARRSSGARIGHKRAKLEKSLETEFQKPKMEPTENHSAAGSKICEPPGV